MQASTKAEISYRLSELHEKIRTFPSKGHEQRIAEKVSILSLMLETVTMIQDVVDAIPKQE